MRSRARSGTKALSLTPMCALFHVCLILCIREHNPQYNEATRVRRWRLVSPHHDPAAPRGLRVCLDPKGAGQPRAELRRAVRRQL